MKKSFILSLASVAATMLMSLSCSKTTFITVYSDHDFEHAISGITLQGADEYNATLTIKPNGGEDWSITIKGDIEGMTVNPAEGKANKDTELHVPANKGGERKGTLVITSDGCTKEIEIKQAGGIG